MPTTRAQDRAAAQNTLKTRNASEDNQLAPEKLASKAKPASRAKPASKAKKPASQKKTAPHSKNQQHAIEVGEKRKAADEAKEEEPEEPSTKKAKTEADDENAAEQRHPAESMYQTGTIERGHIYFFYRPKVELKEAHSIDDVQRFYMLLVPRPPQFAADGPETTSKADDDEQELNLIQEGADAVPAEEPKGQSKKKFRLIVVGKKSLPDPEAKGGGQGNQVFWGSISTIGEDLKKLEEGLGESTYETKTRGTRHQGAARLAARGAYAIVNNEARTPSQRETHLGYHLSHPSGDQLGEVQEALGIHQASSFVLQVKNPLAPPTGPVQVGLPKNRRADYPEEILRGVFGKGGQRGRESYGLRFASCERRELLDYEGTELLFIAARSGEDGLEKSLGEGRGHALEEAEKNEGKSSIGQVLKELAMDDEKIPSDPLEGEWA
ncbi:hypothetical protein BD310DRAFT_961148 [Dichomitus squalens]|uniref:Uncharacterized protein n=1 Tax=Dichomitus squalens TaxID=114155 RepID=A0A4Q9PL58_9APHY|nr:hypothetical protein BD310DRAFT_961148 [Dichomitus squalens]